LWSTQPWLVGLLLLVNALTAFNFTRVFGSIFGGKVTEMSVRSPECFWPITLPMVVELGFVFHLPLILQSFHLLPAWAEMNKDVALMLIWSSIFGLSIGAVVYLGNFIQKPVQLPWKPLQDLFAYDFYTPQLYRVTIVFAVALVSQITAWIDRYIVDGVVNLVGMVTVFSGQSLKYNVSGQTQFYVLTILLGVALLGLLVSWPLLSRLSLLIG
jgi:NAD(P)H-quinone oxidoreductase subunit 5